MDTSLAAEWVTLVESHLLTYSCSTQWNALRFRSQYQSQRWKWLRGMIAGFKQYLKRKNFWASIINDLAFEKITKTKSI